LFGENEVLLNRWLVFRDLKLITPGDLPAAGMMRAVSSQFAAKLKSFEYLGDVIYFEVKINIYI
jgi:hypothetical protein